MHFLVKIFTFATKENVRKWRNASALPHSPGHGMIIPSRPPQFAAEKFPGFLIAGVNVLRFKKPWANVDKGQLFYTRLRGHLGCRLNTAGGPQIFRTHDLVRFPAHNHHHIGASGEIRN
jgi:hypothetical protein